MEEDIKQFIKEEGKKTRDHFDVVAEDLKGTITQVAGGVDTNSQILQRLDKRATKLETDVGTLKNDMSAVKTTLEMVNLPVLKQQVADLLKRVTFLEAKFSQ